MSGAYARAGRLDHGALRMNKTEARYADYLGTLQALGRIREYRFEAVKLRLADNTFLTVDFLVIAADATVELHDVKGRKGKSYYATEDARVKMKVAAAQYPFRFVVAWPDGSNGWRTEEIQG